MAGSSQRYGRSGPGPGGDYGLRGGESHPRWNDTGSISPLDQRRDKVSRGIRSDFRGYDSPGGLIMLSAVGVLCDIQLVLYVSQQ